MKRARSQGERRATRATCVGSGLLVLAATLAMAAPVGAGRVEADYLGSFAGDAGDRVKIELRDRPGRRPKAVVAATNVELHCADGQTRRADFQLTVPFIDARTFRGGYTSEDFHTTKYSTLNIKGHLAPEGKAAGYLTYNEELGDFPGPNPAPPCDTPGRIRWQARETR